jgi:hypothetical protein
VGARVHKAKPLREEPSRPSGARSNRAPHHTYRPQQVISRLILHRQDDLQATAFQAHPRQPSSPAKARTKNFSHSHHTGQVVPAGLGNLPSEGTSTTVRARARWRQTAAGARVGAPLLAGKGFTSRCSSKSDPMPNDETCNSSRAGV